MLNYFIAILAFLFLSIISDKNTLCKDSEVPYAFLSPIENDFDVNIHRIRRAADTNSTIPTTYYKDNHTYYEQHTYMKGSDHGTSLFYITLFDKIFGTSTVSNHKSLSNNHRTALQVTLKFKFKFYGHLITKVTIATGGFLYMSSFLHRWLTYTQYIAPLMANFATRDSTLAGIKYFDTGNAFFVMWDKVHLHDNKNAGNFTFQVGLFKNGTIVFVYREIPLSPKSISDTMHSVKVGLADGYYVDKLQPSLLIHGKQYYTKQRTIYQYHKVSVDMSHVVANTVVVLNPFPTCVEQSSCVACTDPSSVPHFSCSWCPKLRRCSAGVDRHKQIWTLSKCHLRNSGANCPTDSTGFAPTTAGNAQNLSGNKSGKGGSKVSAGRIALIIFISLALVSVVAGIGVWCWYAYTHPTSRSGMWLMENRPSQLREKMSKIRFFKSGDDSGDKYSVSVTAEESVA